MLNADTCTPSMIARATLFRLIELLQMSKPAEICRYHRLRRSKMSVCPYGKTTCRLSAVQQPFPMCQQVALDPGTSFIASASRYYDPFLWAARSLPTSCQAVLTALIYKLMCIMTHLCTSRSSGYLVF